MFHVSNYSYHLCTNGLISYPWPSVIHQIWL